MKKQKNIYKKALNKTDDEIVSPKESSDINQASSGDGLNTLIKPIKIKICESDDTLLRRENWFQRRSGKSD